MVIKTTGSYAELNQIANEMVHQLEAFPGFESTIESTDE